MPRTTARLMTRPTARTYPGYPIGYKLADIGPHSDRVPDSARAGDEGLS